MKKVRSLLFVASISASVATMGMCGKTSETPTATPDLSTPVTTTTGRVAQAVINDQAGAQVGIATFSEHQTGAILVDVNITTATPGRHGMHIHAEGKCEAAGGFMTAGGHFNPTNTNHGDPSSSEHHAGDFGNLSIMQVGANGTGRLQLFSSTISLDPGAANTIIGKSIIFHAGEDDLRTQPTGNSGGRVGCGLIAAKP